MSIELVDKIDQKTSRRYQKVGFNDLLLEEDEGDGVMYDIKPTGSTEDYVGMELENVMEHRTDKKRNRIALAALTTVFFLLISIAVLRGHGKSAAPVVTPAKYHHDGSEIGIQFDGRHFHSQTTRNIGLSAHQAKFLRHLILSSLPARRSDSKPIIGRA